MTAVLTNAATSAPDAQSRPHHLSLYLWAVLILMLLISTSGYIDRVIMGMLVKPIRADLHISDTQFSLLTGPAFAVFYVTLGIPFGWLSDRFSRRTLVSMGCAAWSVMTAACGFVSTYTSLFLCRVGVGVGEATLNPCAYPLISASFPPRLRARAMALYAMGHPVGAGLAMVIGGSVIGMLTAAGTTHVPVFGEMRPWQVVFLIVGLPGLVLALVAAMLLKDPQQSRPPADVPDVATVCRFMWRERKAYGAIVLSLGFLNAFSSGALVWFPAFLMRVHAFSPGRAGLLIGLSSSVGGILGSLALGWLADRLVARGKRDIAVRVIIPALLGTFLCAVIGPIVPIRWLSLTLFAGFGAFLLAPLSIYHFIRQAVTPKEAWGQVTAIYNCISNIMGLMLGPPAMALCTDYVFRDENAVNYSIALVGSVCLSLAVLTLWLGRKILERRFENPAPLRP